MRSLRISSLLFLLLIFASFALAQDAKPEEAKKPDPMTSAFAGLRLRSIGPGVTGGRVSAFAVDPTDRANISLRFLPAECGKQSMQARRGLRCLITMARFR